MLNRTLVFVWAFMILLAGCQQKELIEKIPPASITNTPEEVQITTSDIDLFWEMYDKEIPLFTEMELNEQYVNAGTSALSFFYAKKIKSTEVYTNLLNSWIDRQYYEDVRENTLQIYPHKDKILDAFKAFQKLYPPAVFTDVTLVMGALNTGGVILPNRQIVIATEIFAKEPDTDTEYLSPWLQSVLRSPDYLPVIAVHELVHLQQQRFAEKHNLPLGGRTLLDRALLEGGADFITHLVMNKFLNDQLLSYANPREEQLWTQFSKTMNKNNLGKWLYNGSAATTQPADLGYYIGFKIAQKYYNTAPDKKQAIKNIIEIKNGEKFLKESGYADSFK